MNEIAKALRPVKRRLRLGHARLGAGWGLLVAGAATVGMMIVSFFVPIGARLEMAGALVLGGCLLGTAVGLLLPVKQRHSAQAADAQGLKERAQTALAVTGDSPMAQLLRQDALEALDRLDSRAVPMPPVRRIGLVSLALLGLAAVLACLPNPQNRVLESAAAFERAMESAAEQAREEAEKPMEELSEKERQEMRRLLGELSRELEQADSAMEAMVSIGRAEERLEALRERTAGEAAAQLRAGLSANGLEALASAIQSGDPQAMEQALSQADAQAMAAAAGSLDGDAQNLLASAARSLQNGDAIGALESLSQLSSALQSGELSGLSGAQKLLSSLRGLSGGAQGAGQGGQKGQAGGNASGGEGEEGNGSGAGKGSTNLAQEGGGQEQSGQRGNDTPQYKEAAYERIYDPERLDAAHTDLSAQSPQGEGESTQIQLGPGAGVAGESVPSRQQVYEYAQEAVSAADQQNLTAQEREWVQGYFFSLTE